MGQTIGVNVAKRAYNVDISSQFDGYSGVRIFVGTDENGNSIIYESGDTSGRVLDITNDFGTQAMADNILAEIRGYQYQPLEADGALLNPAAEMGDGVTVNGVYTGIFVRETQFGRLMASSIQAPTDEEIAHEYFTDTASSDRAFTRFVKNTEASIAITATELSAEVSRATEAEGVLRASIVANAESISAEVTRAQNAESNLSAQLTLTASQISAQVTALDNNKLNHTRSNSSFGWQLTSSGFYLNSNGNTRIFEANSSGIKIKGNAEVTGKITATSGYIGNGSQGFTIRASAITNGKSSLNDNYQGVYIGTDGIALGSNFKVDSLGNVIASSLTASNVILDGYLRIGDSYIDANTLRQGAEYAYDGHGDWDWSTWTVQDGYNGWDSAYDSTSWGGYCFENSQRVENSADAWDDAANWVDAANSDVINLNYVYASGFYGDHYGSMFLPGSYGYRQIYLDTAYIDGYGYLYYVAW